MWESIWGWVKFWCSCGGEGFESCDHIFGIIEVFSAIAVGWFYYKKRHEHAKAWETTAMKWTWIVLVISLVISTIFVAPFMKFEESETDRKKAETALEDKNPKLNGFIHRSVIFNEPDTTNAIFLVDVSINNTGGIPSDAEEFEFSAKLTNNIITNAEILDFRDEYKIDFYNNGKPYMADLKRPQLISEKATTPIDVGHNLRGWAAFRIKGMNPNQFQQTNLILSFIDMNGERSFITNGFWKGKAGKLMPLDDLTKPIAGAENIFYPIDQIVQTNWMPPELPAGCSNILVFFGANGLNYSRLTAEISPEGTQFAIKDLPDIYLQNLDKMPSYSPRQKYMWMKSWMQFSIGGKTVPYPVQPIVISNRAYVEVEIPFLNEKRKIVMSDDFDPQLPIPSKFEDAVRALLQTPLPPDAKKKTK